MGLMGREGQVLAAVIHGFLYTGLYGPALYRSMMTQTDGKTRDSYE